MNKYLELVPNEEQVLYCADMLREFDIINGEAKVTTYTDDERLHGLIAEVMIQDYLGLPRVHKGFDNGHDIMVNGLRIDIKCNNNGVLPRDGLVFDVRSDTLHNAVDGFLFVHYCRRNNVYYVLGWLSKFDFLQHCVFHAQGTRKLFADFAYWYDCMSIRYSHIQPVSSLDRVGQGYIV